MSDAAGVCSANQEPNYKDRYDDLQGEDPRFLLGLQEIRVSRVSRFSVSLSPSILVLLEGVCVVVKAVGFSALFVLMGCNGGPALDDTSVTCAEVCTAEFEVRLLDGSESFQLRIYGDEFNTLNIGCPDGVRAGGPGELTATCEGAGVLLQGEGYVFPESFSISVNNGEEQAVSPSWVESEICETLCTSAVVEL